jgi:hypothetical protein
MDSTRITTAGILLVLTLLGCSTGSRQLQAQQPSANALTRRMNDGLAECRRRFHPIKQAIALATCENQYIDLLRPTLPEPDLLDQELAYNLVLAEKVQRGKMTLIERRAAAAQFISQTMAETERRILARRAAAARDLAAAQPSQSIEIEQTPQAQYPRLRNILPQQTRCDTMRVGIMLQTVCN